MKKFALISSILVCFNANITVLAAPPAHYCPNEQGKLFVSATVNDRDPTYTDCHYARAFNYRAFARRWAADIIVRGGDIRKDGYVYEGFRAGHPAREWERGEGNWKCAPFSAQAHNPADQPPVTDVHSCPLEQLH